MGTPMMKFLHAELNNFTYAVFTSLGVPPEDAKSAAEVLGQANLRGVDSHGIDLLPSYVRRLQMGMINSKPQMRIVRESLATVVIDADQALGQVSCTFGMRQAIKKALVAGLGWVNIVNSNHNGALAYYALMAAAQDMIGIASTTTSSCMAPWGSRGPLMGTNPIAIAVPCNSCRPVVLDMACSFLAHGRVRLAEEKGEPLPNGLSIDAKGNATDDPGKHAALLPFGTYKGSGLAMMLGFLSGVLAGSPFTGYRSDRKGSDPSELAHLMVAVNISNFTDPEKFKSSVVETIKAWKQSTIRPGFDEVLLPGEIEWRHLVVRKQSGIPLNASLVAELREIANDLGVAFPSAL